MPALPLFQVDAFTDRPFAGNPAAVCPLQAPLSEAVMQDIAAENNLSETAFFHARGDGSFALRWFTPTAEVDLCGHATLAAAFVLMTELEPARTEATFHTRGGALVVRRDGDLLAMDFPLYRPEPTSPAAAAAVAAALRARPVEVLRAKAFLAVFAAAADVRALAPDMAALGRLDTTVSVTAPGDGLPSGGADAGAGAGVDFVSRYFAPTFGVPEDPVTGSAHCMLAPYWAERLGKRALAARQVSRRGGELRCEIAGDRVLIAGQARLVIRGTLVF